MLHIRFWACALLASAILPVGLEAGAEPLSINEAVTIAIEANDPAVTLFEEKAAALEERAIADSQLADPRLSLGLLNWPVDSFRYTQEPMTRVQVGVKQAFPRGQTLSLRRQRRLAEAKTERAKLDLQLRQIALDTRIAWLELHYWLGARGRVKANRQAVADLVEVTTSVYATGRQVSHDVLRAELELSLLDDRIVNVERRIAMARADLARLVGPQATLRVSPDAAYRLPIPLPRESLRQDLARHPSVSVEDAHILVRNHDIDLARQQYKPGWTIDVGYGARGAGRADFASVGIAIDLPFFTGKRQDRGLAAAKRERQAARLERDARLLELNKLLDRSYADWQRAGERVELYERAVTVRAMETTKAALGAYRSGVSDFAELIRSRLAEFDADLMLLRLRVDRGQVQAQLLYLQGKDHE
ncbi:MAG: TolC family protein [Proteobacteria bacterium]|nr:TolC family protein [Pseudomonadota bacterium]